MAATIGVRSIRGQNRSLESLSTCGLRAVSSADTESSATRLFLGKSEVYAKRVPLRTLLRKSPRRGFRSAAFWTPRESLGAPLAAAYNLTLFICRLSSSRVICDGPKRRAFLYPGADSSERSAILLEPKRGVRAAIVQNLALGKVTMTAKPPFGGLSQRIVPWIRLSNDLQAASSRLRVPSRA